VVQVTAQEGGEQEFANTEVSRSEITGEGEPLVEILAALITKIMEADCASS
jgi:hypothetical protein